MRKAFNKTSFIYGLNDEFIGISLGYDFCAEHEWGIAGIKSLLGIPIELTKKNLGIDYRTMTKFDEESATFQEFNGKANKKEQKMAVLIADRPWNKEQYKEFPKNLPHDMRSFELYIDKAGLMCAWDKDSFGIIVSQEHIEKLRQLYESLKIKDVCIGLFGGGAFENASLTVAIKSKMPDETLEMLKKSDTSSLKSERHA